MYEGTLVAVFDRYTTIVPASCAEGRNGDNMMRPLRSGHGPHARTQLMLSAGGRVVGVEHEPGHADGIMLPTENELKTLLYDQVRKGEKPSSCRTHWDIWVACLDLFQVACKLVEYLSQI